MVSSPVFDRRRSERFAELLDEAAGRRRRHRRTELDGELANLVHLTGRVADVPSAPDPEPEFRAGLRVMLLATIDREGIGATADEKSKQSAARAALSGKTAVVQQVHGAGTGRTRAAVLIGVTAGALALSGVSAASTNSLPGDPLYQVKRSSERAQLALAGSDQSRGQLFLEFANSRLFEAGKVDPGQLAQVLADMDRETRAGVSNLGAAALQRGDMTAIDAIRRFVDQQRKHLAQLQQTRPEGGHEAVGRSLDLLEKVDGRAADLATALTKRCDVQSQDDLGPVPDKSCLS